MQYQFDHSSKSCITNMNKKGNTGFPCLCPFMKKEKKPFRSLISKERECHCDDIETYPINPRFANSRISWHIHKKLQIYMTICFLYV